MLRLVLLVVALTGGCTGDGDGSPPPGEARRVWAAHLDALRRQLMRDNYDYQHTDDDQQHRNTSGGAKLYYQRGEIDHLSRASELLQGNSKVVSLEHGPEHYQQRAQQDRGRQREQWGEYQKRGEHEQQRAQSSRQGQRTQHLQRVQNQQRERGEQLQQIEQQHLVYKDSAEPSLADAPHAPRAAAPDELTARDLFEPEYTSDQRDVTPERAKYKPSNNKLQRDGYSPAQDKSVSDQRGNYNEQYRQDGESDSSNDQKQQTLESDSQDSLSQETIDQQESSWSEDNDKRSVVTRANRLQHHRNAPPYHVRNSHSYRDDNASPDDDRYITKKDLPYYVSGNQLRRRNIADVPDEDQPAAAASLGADRSASSADSRPGRAGIPARRHATTEPPGLPRTERTRHLFVTVSAANVTYELLTLKSRDGRRRGVQRVVEERGPEGVAIISLDEAPLPALRLPRSR